VSQTEKAACSKIAGRFFVNIYTEGFPGTPKVFANLSPGLARQRLPWHQKRLPYSFTPKVLATMRLFDYDELQHLRQHLRCMDNRYQNYPQGKALAR